MVEDRNKSRYERKKFNSDHYLVSTTQAMAMESRGKKTGFEGRIIPVPREISASCGLTWKCGGQNQDTVEKYLSEEELEYEGIYQILM